MKKAKITALIAMILLMSILFASCSARYKARYDDVLSKNYTPLGETVQNALFLQELSGYEVSKCNYEFVLFSQTDSRGLGWYKVFSYASKAVILSVGVVANESYSFEFVEGTSSVRITKTVSTSKYDAEKTYYLYDARGNLISTTKEDWGAPVAFADLVIYGGAMYTVNDDGTLIKKSDLPERTALDGIMACTDEYLYVNSGGSIVVYDHAMNCVSSWNMPDFDYATSSTFNILNNGDIFAQALITVDANSEDYDVITENNQKHRVVSYIVDAQSGKAKEKKFEYFVEDIVSSYEYLQDKDKENYYTDTFENIAYVYPIVDRRIDKSAANKDIVLMKNNGKVMASLKLVDGQYAELPQSLGSDKYLVNTEYGRVIANGEGKILNDINDNNIKLVGNYFVGTEAIYDLEFNKVYDLKQNGASVKATIGDTVFVRVGNSDKYTILAFRNGESRTAFIYDKAVNQNASFVAYSACYGIEDDVSGKYEYYGPNGSRLTTVSKDSLALSCFSSTYNMYIYRCGNYSSATQEYYIFY